MNDKAAPADGALREALARIRDAAADQSEGIGLGQPRKGFATFVWNEAVKALAAADAAPERTVPSRDRLRRALHRHDVLSRAIHDTNDWVDADLCASCDLVAGTLLGSMELMDGPLAFDSKAILAALRAEAKE